MARFHVNTNTGNTGACKAAKGKCPFGGESGDENHYSSPEEANKAAEEFMQEKYSTVNSAYRKKDTVAVNHLPRELKKRILKEAAEGSVNLHPSVAAKVFSKDDDELIRKNVAETFKSQKILREMSTDDSARVRLGVAQSTNNLEVLKALANDPDSKVRNAAIANPKMPAKSRKAVEKAAYEQKLANLKGVKAKGNPVNEEEASPKEKPLKAATHEFTDEEKFELMKGNAQAAYQNLVKNQGLTSSERKTFEKLLNEDKMSDTKADEILANEEEIKARVKRDAVADNYYYGNPVKETHEDVSKILNYVKAAREKSKTPSTNRTLKTFDPSKETMLSEKGRSNPYAAVKELDRSLKTLKRYENMISEAEEANHTLNDDKVDLRTADINEWSAKARSAEAKSLLISKEIQYRAKNDLFESKRGLTEQELNGLIRLPIGSSRFDDVEVPGASKR